MQPTTFDAGFATLADLKAELEITTADKDAMVNRILRGVSGAIEAYSGRPLLRRHAVTEFFRGGQATIRTGTAPIAKVHSIRESETRDFETSGNYEELVEGTDYTLEPSQDGKQDGETGVIRRLTSRFMGRRTDPRQLRVVYTGGYKTDDEEALENGQIVISNASDVIDYGLAQVLDGAGVITLEYDTASEIQLKEISGPSDERFRGLVRFSLSGSILSIWSINEVKLAISMRSDGADQFVTVMVADLDPKIRGQSNLINLYDMIDATDRVKITSTQVSGATFSQFEYDLEQFTNFSAMLALINASVGSADPYIAFGLPNDTRTAVAFLGTSENATPANKPTLTINHGLAFVDSQAVPSDLRHACIIQSVHEFRTRRNPGLTSESARGVAIASGASYMKSPAELLPEVKEIARSYSRLI